MQDLTMNLCQNTTTTMAFMTSVRSDESNSTIVMCSCNGLLTITNLVIHIIIYAIFWHNKNSFLKIQGSLKYAYHITSTTWLQCTKGRIFIYVVIIIIKKDGLEKNSM